MWNLSTCQGHFQTLTGFAKNNLMISFLWGLGERDYMKFLFYQQKKFPLYTVHLHYVCEAQNRDFVIFILISEIVLDFLIFPYAYYISIFTSCKSRQHKVHEHPAGLEYLVEPKDSPCGDGDVEELSAELHRGLAFFLDICCFDLVTVCIVSPSQNASDGCFIHTFIYLLLF